MMFEGTDYFLKEAQSLRESSEEIERELGTWRTPKPVLDEPYKTFRGQTPERSVYVPPSQTQSSANARSQYRANVVLRNESSLSSGDRLRPYVHPSPVYTSRINTKPGSPPLQTVHRNYFPNTIESPRNGVLPGHHTVTPQRNTLSRDAPYTTSPKSDVSDTRNPFTTSESSSEETPDVQSGIATTHTEHEGANGSADSDKKGCLKAALLITGVILLWVLCCPLMACWYLIYWCHKPTASRFSVGSSSQISRWSWQAPMDSSPDPPEWRGPRDTAPDLRQPPMALRPAQPSYRRELARDWKQSPLHASANAESPTGISALHSPRADVLSTSGAAYSPHPKSSLQYSGATPDSSMDNYPVSGGPWMSKPTWGMSSNASPDLPAPMISEGRVSRPPRAMYPESPASMASEGRVSRSPRVMYPESPASMASEGRVSRPPRVMYPESPASMASEGRTPKPPRIMLPSAASSATSSPFQPIPDSPHSIASPPPSPVYLNTGPLSTHRVATGSHSPLPAQSQSSLGDLARPASSPPRTLPTMTKDRPVAGSSQYVGSSASPSQHSISHHFPSHPREPSPSHLGHPYPARPSQPSHAPRLLDRYFLMISFPSATRLTYEEDARARELVFCSFRDAHIGYKEAPHKNRFEVVEVRRWREMTDTIRRFLETDARLAKEATVIFNGHGRKEGLILAGETFPVGLDHIIHRVRVILVITRDIYRIKTPRMVRLVFAQCYGHVFTPPGHQALTVMSLSRDKPGHEVTSLLVKRRPRRRPTPGGTSQGPATGRQEPGSSQQTLAQHQGAMAVVQGKTRNQGPVITGKRSTEAHQGHVDLGQGPSVSWNRATPGGQGLPAVRPSPATGLYEPPLQSQQSPIPTVQGNMISQHAPQEPLTSLGQGPLTSLGQGPLTSLSQGPLTSMGQGPLTSMGQGPLTSLGQGPLTSLGQGPLTSMGQGPLTSLGQGPLTSLGQGPLASLSQEPLTSMGQGPLTHLQKSGNNKELILTVPRKFHLVDRRGITGPRVCVPVVHAPVYSTPVAANLMAKCEAEPAACLARTSPGQIDGQDTPCSGRTGEPGLRAHSATSNATPPSPPALLVADSHKVARLPPPSDPESVDSGAILSKRLLNKRPSIIQARILELINFADKDTRSPSSSASTTPRTTGYLNGHSSPRSLDNPRMSDPSDWSTRRPPRANCRRQGENRVGMNGDEKDRQWLTAPSRINYRILPGQRTGQQSSADRRSSGHVSKQSPSDLTSFNKRTPTLRSSDRMLHNDRLKQESPFGIDYSQRHRESPGSCSIASMRSMGHSSSGLVGHRSLGSNYLRSNSAPLYENGYFAAEAIKRRGQSSPELSVQMPQRSTGQVSQGLLGQSSGTPDNQDTHVQSSIGVSAARSPKNPMSGADWWRKLAELTRDTRGQGSRSPYQLQGGGLVGGGVALHDVYRDVERDSVLGDLV